jgi:hypothetical protein
VNEPLTWPLSCCMCSEGGDRLQWQWRVATVFSQAIVNRSSGDDSESLVKQSHCLW